MDQRIRSGQQTSSARSVWSQHLLSFVAVVLLAAAVVMVLGPDVAEANNGKGKGGGGGSGGGGGGGWEPPDPIPFADCGTVVQGVECLLWQSDNFGTYVVSGIQGGGIGGPVEIMGGDGGVAGDSTHQPGDRVYVEGLLDPYCTTFCQQGSGCIGSTTLSDCPEEAQQNPAERYTVTDLLDLFGSWGPCITEGGCQWDMNGDGAIGPDDAMVVLGNLE